MKGTEYGVSWGFKKIHSALGQRWIRLAQIATTIINVWS